MACWVKGSLPLLWLFEHRADLPRVIPWLRRRKSRIFLGCFGDLGIGASEAVEAAALMDDRNISLKTKWYELSIEMLDTRNSECILVQVGESKEVLWSPEGDLTHAS